MIERFDPFERKYDESTWRYVRLRAKYCAQKTRGRVLDVGCGIGIITKHVADAGAVESVVAIDYSPEAIAKARLKFGHGKIRYLAANALDLPLDDDSFDTVLIAEVIEHLDLDDQRRLLEEAGRVLRPGGRIFGTTPEVQREGSRSRESHRYEHTFDSLARTLEEFFPGAVITRDQFLCWEAALEPERAGAQAERPAEAAGKGIESKPYPTFKLPAAPQSETSEPTENAPPPLVGKETKTNQPKTVILTTSAAPDLSPFSTTEKLPPLGVGSLVSVLRGAGHQTAFVDSYLRPSGFPGSLGLAEHSVDAVGIYANTICLHDTLRMIDELEAQRKQGWKGKILVGGPHASVAPETLPDAVDHIVLGEGERAILDIVEGRTEDRIVRAPRIKDLDDLPFTPWDLFAKGPYNFSVPWFPEGPVFPMNTSRGCPFQCSFCSVGSVWGKKYTTMSAERIVEEISHMVSSYGVRGIYFREDNFTLRRDRVEAFCDLVQSKAPGIKWVCETRVSSLDRDLIRTMYEAGCRAYYIGAESGSQRLLDFLRKGITVEQIREVFAWCREIGMRTAASFVVGVPTETAEELAETLRLGKEIRPDTCWWNIFVGIPTSELYRYVLDNNLYEHIDDRGLVYLKGHNERVDRFYNGLPSAKIPTAALNAAKPQAISYQPSAVSSPNPRPTENSRKSSGKDPRVSVVMSVYNGEKYLAGAIRSILAQTFTDFEFIIIDDGSTDGSRAIIQRLEDPRIRLIAQENWGLAAALNRGIGLARGAYMARMDADDISAPTRLAEQVDFLDAHPEIGMVGSSFHQIDEAGRVTALTPVLTTNEEIQCHLLEQNWFCHGSVMVRRECLDEAGGYDETFTSAQDYDLWLRISEAYQVANLSKPLYRWRLSPEGVTVKRKAEQDRCARLARERAVERRGSGKSLPAQATPADPDPPPAVTQSSGPDISPPRLVVEAQSAQSPKVSVIVPTHNRPDMLTETLRSILDQTFRDFEIIVVNDAGVEVDSLLKWIDTEGRITYVRHAKNQGLAAARNTGLRMARGAYMAYLDDDDVMYPDHLATLVEAIEEGPCKVVYTDAHLAMQALQGTRHVTVERTVAYSQDFNRDLFLVTNYIPVLCFLHARECTEKVGGFDESLKVHEDHDLWIRMSRHYDFRHIKKVTSEFRMRSDKSNMSSALEPEFLTTIDHLYKRYAHLTKDRPDLIAAQERFLKQLRERIQQSEAGLPGSAPKSVQLDSPAPSEGPSPTPAPLTGSAAAAQPEVPIEVQQTAKRVSVSEPATQAGLEGPTCSIIIPVYNQIEHTGRCLDAIERNTGRSSYEIIIVDNASSDGTASYLEKIKRHVRTVTNTENLGFSKANNQGARIARGKFLVFLNNDTVPQPGWLDAMVDTALSRPDAAVVGAKLLYPDDTIQHAGVIFNQKLRAPYHIYQGLHRNHPATNREREFPVVTGACMLVLRSIFQDVGGFDESYINCFEDVDFCLRVREKGHKVFYTPHSIVYHFEGQSEGRRDAILKSGRILAAKWGDKLPLDEETRILDEDGFKVAYTEEGKIMIRTKSGYDVGRLAEARMHEEKGLFDLAVKVYQSVLKAKPDCAEAYHGLGRIHQMMNQFKEAEECFIRLVKLEPKIDHFLALAKLHIKQGKIIRAIESLDRARSLNGHKDAVAFEIYTSLGDCYVKTGHLEAARKSYSQAEECDIESEKPFLGYGSIAMLSGDFLTARKRFSKALGMNRRSDKALCGLGISCMESGDGEAGFQYICDALSVNPDNLTALFSIIKAAYSLDRLEVAEEHLKKYLALHPANIDVLYSLGGVCFKQNKYAEAREMTEKVLIFKPDHEGAREILSALAQAGHGESDVLKEKETAARRAAQGSEAKPTSEAQERPIVKRPQEGKARVNELA